MFDFIKYFAKHFIFPIYMSWLIFPICITLRLSTINCICICCDKSSSLRRLFWTSNLDNLVILLLAMFPIFASSTYLTALQFKSTSRSFMYIMNNTRPCTEPSGKSFVVLTQCCSYIKCNFFALHCMISYRLIISLIES